MTASFSLELNGKPTFFVEKIQAAIREITGKPIDRKYILSDQADANPVVGTIRPKLHTIRRDKNDRWGVDRLIHFVIHNRTPDRFQFAPAMPCISTQTIRIKHSGESWRQPWVTIDGWMQTGDEITALALNDGFESTKEFFEYFSEDYTGKIIHWTDLKYR